MCDNERTLVISHSGLAQTPSDFRINPLWIPDRGTGMRRWISVDAWTAKYKNAGLVVIGVHSLR
jgi:hypothetical protein